MQYIQTYTGNRVYFDSPKEQDIDIIDIAHSLSNICRYNGHSTKFWSVAQHSVEVMSMVKDAMGPYVRGDCNILLKALLHDASEAYLCDIPRPLKWLLRDYKPLENRFEDVIFTKYGLADVGSDFIKLCDNKILHEEAKYLIQPVGVYKYDWDSTDSVDVRKVTKNWEFPYNDILSPSAAKSIFLHHFYQLRELQREEKTNG